MPRLSEGSRRDYMLTAPLHRLIPAMAVPTIIAMLITSIYNLADTYFVSKLGTYATGAVGVNQSLDSIIAMAGNFLGLGAGSFISRLLGQKRKEKAESVLSTAFLTALCTGTIVLILGFSFMRPMVRLLGATELVEGYAVDYASYVLLAAPFMAATFVLNSSLRSEGSATLSMIGMAAGAVLNIILDPIFIFTLGLGVRGASLATAISKVVSFLILLLPYLRRKTQLRLSFRKVKYARDTVSEVAKMGTPTFSRTLLSILAGIVLNNIAGNYSESTLAAVSVVNRISFMINALTLGFGQGFQPVAGFCYGAKRYGRVLEAYRFAVIVAVSFMTLVSITLFIFAEPIIGLFTETDSELLRLGTLALRTQAIVVPFNAWAVMTNMLHSGCGKALGALILSTCRQGYCFYPMVFLMPYLFGGDGVALVQAASDTLALVVTIIMTAHVIREFKTLQLSESGEELPSPDGEPAAEAMALPAGGTDTEDLTLEADVSGA